MMVESFGTFALQKATTLESSSSSFPPNREAVNYFIIQGVGYVRELLNDVGHHTYLL